ncbi:MAG: DUF2125 domain-containing protein [Pseudomonadota bacterium]
MTDESFTDAPIPAPKKKRGLVLPVAALIVVIAVGGFVASRAGLDKALVKQQVDNFIVQMKERGRAQGRDIDITYGDLEVVGSFASKHVVIHNPAMAVKPIERKPAVPGAQKKIDAVVVTTPTLAIYPRAVDLSSLRIQLAEPINVAAEEAPEKSLLKVTSNVPLQFDVSKTTKENVEYTDVAYESPSQMDFVYLREEQAKGEEEKTPSLVPVYDTLHIATAQGSGMSSSMAGDASGLGKANINFKDLVITPQAAPEGAIKIAEVTADWSNALNEQKLNVISMTSKVGPVTSDNTAAPYLPVTLQLDATYEGTLPKTPEAIAASKAQESLLKLKMFSLTTKDASLSATADFTASAADVLPVGKATITLTNTPYVLAELHKQGVLNEANTALMGTVLQLVTATPLDQLKDATIPIERARGGAFKIGQTTFEELFAVFLKQAMQNKAGAAPTIVVPEGATVTPPAGQAPLVPQLPAADKPKAAPIAVPDHGVRG